jgi:predicted amidohydrolase YtcJ
MKNNGLLILFIFITMSVISQTKQKADLILHNGNVYTIDNKFSKVSAFAVKDGRFIAVGDEKDILDNFESEEIIDAQGQFVFPGFNDGHSHFLGYGIWTILYANLVGSASMKDVVDILKRYDKEHNPEWLLGRGWDQNDWKNTDFPDNTLLNKVFPDKPVLLTRIDGHAVLANDKALKIAGINLETKIEGGDIIVKNGKLTGILVDNAADVIKNAVPPFTRQQKEKALTDAQKNCFAAGLTTVTDAGLDKADILLIDSLQQTGKLKIRVYAMMNPTDENFEYFYSQKPWHKDRLTVCAVKLYADGALGSRGALLLEEYNDDPDNYGLQLNNVNYYNEMCSKAYKAGFQVNTHAIGDSANRMMLKIYSKYLKTKNDRRWRIEHAQIVAKDDLHYFGDYSIIPSIQATHCTSDMYWAEKRLGSERIKTAYAYKDLLKQNGWLINGTDFPIEDISPLKTFYASVTRKDKKGWPKEGFLFENALSREEALKSITIWAAKGSFDDKQKGTIEVGKVADFVILDNDLITVRENKMQKVSVLATFLNGEKVYEKNR